MKPKIGDRITVAIEGVVDGELDGCTTFLHSVTGQRFITRYCKIISVQPRPLAVGDEVVGPNSQHSKIEHINGDYVLLSTPKGRCYTAKLSQVERV